MLWKLRQEKDSKAKIHAAGVSPGITQDLLQELLSNASGGIYPGAREGFYQNRRSFS